MTDVTMIEKHVRIENKAYLEWVRQQPCLITNRTENIDAHHLLRAEARGMARKTGDNWAVPLTHTMHRMLHEHGNEVAFFKNYGHPYEVVKEWCEYNYGVFIGSKMALF